jgi:hypothetical protein
VVVTGVHVNYYETFSQTFSGNGRIYGKIYKRINEQKIRSPDKNLFIRHMILNSKGSWFWCLHKCIFGLDNYHAHSSPDRYVAYFESILHGKLTLTSACRNLKPKELKQKSTGSATFHLVASMLQFCDYQKMYFKNMLRAFLEINNDMRWVVYLISCQNVSKLMFPMQQQLRGASRYLTDYWRKHATAGVLAEKSRISEVKSA